MAAQDTPAINFRSKLFWKNTAVATVPATLPAYSSSFAPDELPNMITAAELVQEPNIVNQNVFGADVSLQLVGQSDLPSLVYEFLWTATDYNKYKAVEQDGKIYPFRMSIKEGKGATADESHILFYASFASVGTVVTTDAGSICRVTLAAKSGFSNALVAS